MSRIAGGKPDPDGACVGIFVKLGGKEMEVDCPVSKDDFLSGRVFGKGAFGLQPAEEQTLSRSIAPALKKKFVAPFKPVSMNALNGAPRKVAGDTKKSVHGEADEEAENKPTTSHSTVLNGQLTRYWSAHW